MIDRGKKLKKIAEEIKNCTTCKQNAIGKAVPGEGKADASVVFVGEAPGRQEAISGRPFIGRSGQLLRMAIRDVLHLNEDEVFITSAVKYLPKKGTPSKQDILHDKPFLLRQIDVINPKIVVLLGSVACKSLLGTSVTVTKDHGKTVQKDSRIYFISYHPAAALRFPKLKEIFFADFNQLHKVLAKM